MSKFFRKMSNKELLTEYKYMQKPTAVRIPEYKKGLYAEIARRKKAGLMKKSAGRKQPSRSHWGF